MDQAKEVTKSGSHTDFEENSLVHLINNASIVAEMKIEIMQGAVAKCPKQCISTHGIKILSLLDSNSEVTLHWKSHLIKHVLPKIKVAVGEKADTHSLFRLSVAKDGKMPIKNVHQTQSYLFWA